MESTVPEASDLSCCQFRTEITAPLHESESVLTIRDRVGYFLLRGTEGQYNCPSDLHARTHACSALSLVDRE